MKKWTVMLIARDRGSSRTLNLRAYQPWVVATLLAGLSFSSTFLYERHQAYGREIHRLRQVKRDLEIQTAKQAAQARQPLSTAQERIELEQRLRAEYDASVAAITAELSDLRDMENQARSLTGIAPRTPIRESGNKATGGGKGGGTSSLMDVAYDEDDDTVVSPSVIYGLAQPSADLIIQEIDLRKNSLRALVTDLRVREEQVARVPSIWPTASDNREVSSPFGYRKDPYDLRIGHHDGTDISAPYGSPVLATAKGVVVYSQYDPAGLGNLVKIDHGNGVETWYGHLAARLVGVGDAVERKTAIGKLGTTGRSTGPHIHYEVHVNGKPVDPVKYFRD